jgi:CMP-N-acetylneuraminic acid synthetase
MIKTLGLIPARSGSKRLEGKNIKLMNGKPMLAYTIQAALQSDLSDVVVSTDSEEIADIARQFGAQVPFIRPHELSDDRTTNKNVLAHALSFLEEKQFMEYELLFLLQPTSPIRKSTHINDCIQLLADSNFDTLASVYGPIKKNQKNLKILTPEKELLEYRDGELCEYYCYNASIYGSKRDFFIRTMNYHAGRQVGYVMDKLHSIDVDDEYDFEIASHMMKKYCAQE